MMTPNAYDKRTLAEIAISFQCEGTWQDAQPYGSGHINDTYKTTFEVDGHKTNYIVQRVNHTVFEDVPALMENIGNVTRHQRKKLEAAGVNDLDRRVLTLVPTLEGQDFLRDEEGNYWRTYLFVEDAIGIDVVENTGQAYEAAKAFGDFQCRLSDLPARLHETIPNFHHTRSRFDALLKAIEADSCNRAAAVTMDIEFALANEPLVDRVIQGMAAGEIPERVTHNDTKLNNVLIDMHTGRGACVIDLDTVMPGSVLYDFGDLVRTTTTRVAEDEADPSRVSMEMDLYEALVQGYLEAAIDFLVPAEVALLPMAGKLITFETGLRFLTDYLEGDLYFKTHREGQNLDRSRKQFLMVQSMDAQMDRMQQMVETFR